MSQFANVLQTVLGIGLLIFVHELGHYLAARLAGIRVDVFSLGFGPRLFGFRAGPTDYRLCLLPLGGYVRVAGEDAVDRSLLERDELYAKGYLARTLFFSGGVLMNLLFAMVAFPIVFRTGVEFTAPVLGAVHTGGPAWEAELRPGDRIRAAHGKEMYSFENLQVEIALAGRKGLELTVERDGRVFPVQVQPRYSDTLGIFSLEVGPPVRGGAAHVQVRAGGPAAQAGLRDGDRLTHLDGVPASPDEVDAQLAAVLRAPARPLALGVLRDGQTHTVEYTPAPDPAGRPSLGVLRAERRVAGMRGDLPALARLDLRRGDHVVLVDGRPFAGRDLAPLLRPDVPFELVVEREGEGRRSLRGSLRSDELAALPRHLAFGYDTIGVGVTPFPGSPAAVAGLRAGDEIVAVAGERMGGWTDLQQAMRRSSGQEVVLRVRRGAEEQEFRVQPAPPLDLGFVTVAPILREVYAKDSVPEALRAGMVASLDLVKQLYVTLKRLVTGDVSARNLGGIIQISVVSYEYAKSGWARFFYFLGLLSINLAFINVLPIPILDGGHLLFLLVERIKGSPVSPRVLHYSQILGLVFVVALMVFVTFNDIRRLF
ncbi:MAG: RIP metalloprotease RseP [Planctomycetes bacterium]|nr:RIP metalloprotease RseP [Planctomycetota bacterium]